MRSNRVKSTAELLESARPLRVHPIVELCQEHGFKETKVLEHGNRRVLTKGDYPKIVIHLFDKSLFLCAYIHEAADRNIGKVKEPALRAWLEGSLCLTEYDEPQIRLRYCKRLSGHDDACGDEEGTFPLEAA